MKFDFTRPAKNYQLAFRIPTEDYHTLKEISEEKHISVPEVAFVLLKAAINEYKQNPNQ